MKGSPAILARTIALGGLPGGSVGCSVGRSVGYDVGAGIRDHRATIHVLLRGAYRLIGTKPLHCERNTNKAKPCERKSRKSSLATTPQAT